jgi:hypothetical protein
LYDEADHPNCSELDWDKDVNLPLEQRFSRRLTTDVVFVGLNMAGNGTPPKWPPFNNACGHENIVTIQSQRNLRNFSCSPVL